MSACTIPNVIARDACDDRVLEVLSHLLTERIISIGTAIDAGVANALIAQLLFLESDNPGSDLRVSVNSDGGDPSAMLAEHSGQSIDHLRADTHHDRVFSAHQAQRCRLVDDVITRRCRAASPTAPQAATRKLLRSCSPPVPAERGRPRAPSARVPSPTSTAETPLRDEQRREGCPRSRDDKRGVPRQRPTPKRLGILEPHDSSLVPRETCGVPVRCS